MQQDILQQLKSKDPEQRKQAISQLAKSKNEKALPLLAKIAEKDPDASVRQLADKAQQFIKKHTLPAPAGAVPAPPPLTGKKKASKAQPYIEETKRLLAANAPQKAERTLINALLVDPAIQQDEAVGKLAMEITGKPPRIAIETLLKKAGVLGKRTAGSRVSPVYTVLRFIALTAAVFTLIGLIIWANNTGQFDELRVAMQMGNWENNKYSTGRFDYYVLVPNGQPPTDGFPVLVVLHGYGGTGMDLLPRYAPQVNDEGFILVSPNFGDYEFPYDVFVIPNLHSMLTTVEANFPAQANNITLYGFSAGAEIASMYTQTYPSRVSAQVLEGAPEIHTPTSGYAPTVVLYGDQDNLRQMTGSSVNVLRDRGYLHANRTLEGIGHEATASGLNWSLQMLQEF